MYLVQGKQKRELAYGILPVWQNGAISCWQRDGKYFPSPFDMLRPRAITGWEMSCPLNSVLIRSAKWFVVVRYETLIMASSLLSNLFFHHDLLMDPLGDTLRGFGALQDISGSYSTYDEYDHSGPDDGYSHSSDDGRHGLKHGHTEEEECCPLVVDFLNLAAIIFSIAGAALLLSQVIAIEIMAGRKRRSLSKPVFEEGKTISMVLGKNMDKLPNISLRF